MSSKLAFLMHFHFLSALVAKNLNRDHVQLWRKLSWLHNDSAPMTLFNSVYGPNEDCPDFYEQLFSIVSLSGDYPIILVGDWIWY